MAPTGIIRTESMALSDLKPHPRNYNAHPADQVAHLAQSIRENGLYRSIVIAQDNTILAGHGIAMGAHAAGLTTVSVVRLPLDPDSPRALKILAGDNTVSHLAEADDRALVELLREISEADGVGLLGTGYDEMMLANLVFVTRPESEVPDIDAAAHWVGMPEYEQGEGLIQLLINFNTPEDRDEFVEKLHLELDSRKRSAPWPPRDRADRASILFTG